MDLAEMTQEQLIAELITAQSEREMYKTIADGYDSDEFWKTIASAAVEHNLCEVFEKVLGAVGLEEPVMSVELTEVRTHRFDVPLIELYRNTDGDPDSLHQTVADDMAWLKQWPPADAGNDDITAEFVLQRRYSPNTLTTTSAVTEAAITRKTEDQ